MPVLAISCHAKGPPRAKHEHFPPRPIEAIRGWADRPGGYSSVSEYARELIRADEKRKAEEQLEALPLEGLRGEETLFAREDWQAIRQEAMTRVKKARKRHP
jgi:antitoxin ParD1/3/4